MSTIFQLNADELTPFFLEKLKAMFAHQHIRIFVTSEEIPAVFPHGNAIPKGVVGEDLIKVIDSLPRFSKEDSEAFAKDLGEIRRMGNTPLPPNPWAS